MILTGMMTCATMVSEAQQVEGRVIDAVRNPIEAATVVLQARDSSFVGATVTDSLGYFRFEQSPDCYRLIFQHILYRTVEKEGCGADAGEVELAAQDYALDEVVVRGERPLVKVEKGALSYDAAVLAERTTATTVFEALTRVPGIREQENDVILSGAGDVNLLINGKPSGMNREQLIMLLKSLPASEVGQIEVMYNTPAQYRVRGASVNIRLKAEKSREPLLRGEVRGDFTQSRYSQGGGNVNLSYSGEKLSADVSYSPGYTKTDANDMDLEALHTLSTGSPYEINQNDRGYQQRTVHNLRVGLDYQPDERNNFQLAYTTALMRHGKSLNRSWGTFSEAENFKTSENQMHNVAADYTAGFGLNVGLDYTYYQSPAVQNYSGTDTDGAAERFRVDDRQKINRWKVYAGQKHALGGGWGLNYGLDFTFADEKSGQTYHRLDGKPADNPVDTHIKEETYNFYAGVEKAFSEKLAMALSVAGECYQLMDYRKWAVYPTFQLSYQQSPEHIFQLGFSSDKAYPDYWTLQNTVSYLNGYTKIVGNPNLRPSSEYTANLTYVWRGKYVANLSYSYTKDYFVQLPYQSPEELSLVYQFINFNYQQDITLAFILPFTAGQVWNADLTLTGSYLKEKCDPYHDIAIDRGRFMGAAILNNTFRIASKPDIRFELNGMYVSSPLQGLMTLTDVWKLDAGVKWTSADKKMELKLSGNDLLNTSMPNAHIDYRGQRLDMRMLETTRNLMVSFTYRFGGYTEKKHKEVDTSRFGY